MGRLKPVARDGMGSCAIAGRQDRQLAFGDPRVGFLVEIGAVDQLHALKQPFVERARDRVGTIPHESTP